MTANEKRSKQRNSDRAVVERLIDQGQLDINECDSYDYVANIARHSLCWSVGRLNKVVQQIKKER
ncbi:hypothetical protein E2P64_07605 [Candidatus Bathyarchaeota archaeon]|nr:hypothetical protein E2P64_07605 [Candidatus Bathyarchaeota archaeon]